MEKTSDHEDYKNHLKQDLANYGLLVRSGLPPVFFFFK